MIVLLAEVLVEPLLQGRQDLQQAYRSILQSSQNFYLVNVSEFIAEEAARLRAQYSLRTPDPIHMATALHTGCNAFLTNDRGLRRVTQIPVPVLDDLVP